MTTTSEVRTVKVAEFRHLTSALSHAFASVRGCTLSERQREAAWVREAATALMHVTCPRASAYDRDHAERLVDLTASWLIERGLNHGGPNA